MVKLAPFSNLTPKDEYLRHILSLFESNDNLSLQQILSQSKLTKTQSLTALDALVELKKLVRDEIKNIFYLL